MSDKTPLEKTKDEHKEIIAKLSSPDSPVGIDAAYTHAVIIDYLQRLEKRIDSLEEMIKNK